MQTRETHLNRLSLRKKLSFFFGVLLHGFSIFGERSTSHTHITLTMQMQTTAINEGKIWSRAHSTFHLCEL